jgi:hypothetical protein
MHRSLNQIVGEQNEVERRRIYHAQSHWDGTRANHNALRTAWKTVNL